MLNYSQRGVGIQVIKAGYLLGSIRLRGDEWMFEGSRTCEALSVDDLANLRNYMIYLGGRSLEGKPSK